MGRIYWSCAVIAPTFGPRCIDTLSWAGRWSAGTNQHGKETYRRRKNIRVLNVTFYYHKCNNKSFFKERLCFWLNTGLVKNQDVISTKGSTSNQISILKNIYDLDTFPSIITLRPRQNGRHFADDMFKCIFLNENVRISIKISLKFVPKGSINNNPALFQIMAWRRPGDRPLSEPMMASSLTHICVTRPQWVIVTILITVKFCFTPVHKS